MTIWRRFWIFWAVLTLGLWLSYPAHGQQTTSANLLASPAMTSVPPFALVPQGWAISGMMGGQSSDNPALGGYTFSYQSGTIAQTYAINQALAGVGAGILVHGFNYGFEYTFACANQIGGYCTNTKGIQDTLNATATITSNTGAVLYSRYYGLGAKNASDGNAPYNPAWQQVNTQQRFASPYSLASLGNFTLSITGMDGGFWGGNYGPTVRNAFSQAVYGPDLCAQNPLSDPTCPGYAAALLAQQCTANPLSDPTCPGYAQASFIQQCTANPLYEPACPGYQQALFQQQCRQNPLSDPQCPGYAAITQNTTTYAATATSSTTTVSVTGTVSTTEPTITIATDGTVTTGVATVPQTEVNAVITRQIPSTASPTGSVTLQVQTQPAKESDEKKQLRAATEAEREIALREEKKREEEASERRKELAARMRAAAQEAAVNRGREAIRDADRAQTMEQQMANQNFIVATMNFVPGFESYGLARLPDSPGYRPYEIYRGQNNVDNRRLMRRLTGASDQRHAEMVDSQYGR